MLAPNVRSGVLVVDRRTGSFCKRCRPLDMRTATVYRMALNMRTAIVYRMAQLTGCCFVLCLLEIRWTSTCQRHH
jgi:hypothetical protein